MAPRVVPPGDEPAIPFRSTPLSLDAFDDRGSQLLYAYWQRKLNGRCMPARSDIEPLDLKPVLSQLLLLDVQREPLDFRFRLAGTRTYDIFGVDLTGHSLRDIEPRAFSEGIWTSLAALVRTGQPQHEHLQFTTKDGYARSYRVLRLPLGADGATVDRVLVLTTFERGRGP